MTIIYEILKEIRYRLSYKADSIDFRNLSSESLKNI